MPSATFTVFDSSHCAYVDTTGSGSETIAHCYENGRVTIMFCSFDTLPRIMRWYCWGSVVEKYDPQFIPMLRRMGKERPDGARAIIKLEIFKVTTSCGTGVPILGRPQSMEEEMENDSGAADGLPIRTTIQGLFQDRQTLNHWAQNMEGKEKMEDYQRDKNAYSLDGVPGMKRARRAKGQWLLLEDLKAEILRSSKETGGLILGVTMGVVFVLALRMASIV